MRFLILVRADERTESGVSPSPALNAAMAGFHGELARAGVLLDAAGLQPSAQGWRVRYDGAARTAAAGPFDDSRSVAGYTLIQVRSSDEALEWARRFPQPAADGIAEIEVRPLLDADDRARIDTIDRPRRPDTADR